VASVALLGLVGLVAGGGCTSDKAVMAQAQSFNTDLTPAVMNDPQLTQYLQTVGDRIIAAAREMDQQHYGPESHFKESSSWMFSQNMKFHLVNSKTLNAFTTGGEHMYIYNELFQQCKDENELAAVMSHEYGHVYARHVQKGMDRQMGIMGATTGVGVVGSLLGGDKYNQQYGAAASGLVGATANFIGMGFTRKDESEADKLGFDFYTRAGWDPNRFGAFFQHMIDLGLDTGSEYLSDHPSLKSRVENAKKWAAELPASAKSWQKPPVADAQQFKALQARAKQLGASMPTDQSIANAQKILQAMPRSCLTPTIPPDQTRARQELVQMTKQHQAAAKAKKAQAAPQQ
jgi:predicted Zn-dependent protease